MSKTESAPTVPMPDEAMLARIEEDLSQIDFREPITGGSQESSRLPNESYFDWQNRAKKLDNARNHADEETDHQWLMVTEMMRRGVATSQDVRDSLVGIVALPLSEALPLQVVSAAAEKSSRVARVARVSKSLGDLLRLDAVPDELIVPDITYAPLLKRKTEFAAQLENTVSYGGDYNTRLEQLQTSVQKRPGITKQEKQLIARRYRYARDVKLLGLMAELHDQPFNPTEPIEGIVQHTLESGTSVVMTAEASQQYPGLLDPETWQSRKQLKDRVHEVTINGRQFIMKERKTSRHTDVKKGGHTDGVRSAEEFATALEFSQLGSVSTNPDVDVVWEKPLGYVEFPDGFEFCMFEKVPDLIIEATDAALLLENEIYNNPDSFQEEFEAVREQARILYEQDPKFAERGETDRETLQKLKPKHPLLSRLRPGYRKDYEKAKRDLTELTFDDYVEIKARLLVDEAHEILGKTIESNGYINKDIDGYGLRVIKGDRPTIQLVGFDFEYYERNDDVAYDPSFSSDMDETYVWRQSSPKGISRAATKVLVDDCRKRLFGKSSLLV